LAEIRVKTIEHEVLYFQYWITFILYDLVNKNFHFESDIICGTLSAYNNVSFWITRGKTFQ
jgi:hypothetical protein